MGVAAKVRTEGSRGCLASEGAICRGGLDKSSLKLQYDRDQRANTESAPESFNCPPGHLMDDRTKAIIEEL